MIRIADRHLGTTAVAGMLLALLTLLALDAFFAVISELGDVGKGRYTVPKALWYVVLTLPRRAYDLFPVASVVGALVGIGGLAASSELIAYRAAGMSRLRIASGVVLSTILVMGPMLFVGEWLAPRTEGVAQMLRVSAQSDNVAVGSDSSLWVRDGNRFINARKPLFGADVDAIVLSDIDLFDIRAGQLEEIAHADSARLSGGQWVAENIERSRLGMDRVDTESMEQETWASLIDPGVLETAVTRPRHLSLSQLIPYVRYLEANDLDAASYRSAMWWRIAYPITAVVVVLAGMIFVFGSFRSGGLGQRLFLGMLLGIGFFFANRIAVSLGEVYQISAAAMAFTPSVLLALVSVRILRKGV